MTIEEGDDEVWIETKVDEDGSGTSSHAKKISPRCEQSSVSEKDEKDDLKTN